MKKFIIKMSIFLSIVAVPAIIISASYKKTNWYKLSNELVNVRVFPKEIEVLNLGNSREMYGMRYADCYKGSAHNFASSSQPLYYDLQVLKHAENSIKKDAVVLIPLSYFDWEYNWRELFKIDTGAYNKRYYGTIEPWNMYNFNFEQYIKYGVLPVLSAKDNLKYILDDVSMIKGYTTAEVENIDQEVLRTISSWEKGVIAPTDEKEDVIKGNKRDFDDLIQYCKKKGYKPVIFSTPITKEFTANYPKQKIQEFYNITKEMMDKYPDLLFLDYSSDEIISSNTKFFVDAVHMNDVGADAFTKALLKRLAQEGYINRDSIK